MLGRKPLYAVLFLLAVMALGRSLPLVSWLWYGGLSFGLDDVRDPKGLKPWDPRPEPTGIVESKVAVYGPYSTEHFRDTVDHTSYPALPPDVAVEASATETVKLAGGEELRLRAIQFFPQKLRGAQEFLPVEKVFYDPSGTPMTREQAMPLNVIEPRSTRDPALIWNNTVDNGLPWTVGYVVQSNLREEDLGLFGVYDTRTGYHVGWYGSSVPSPFPDPQGGPDTLRLFYAVADAVRPTRQAIHFRVMTGDETVIRLTPTAPQKFTCLGESFTLLTVVAWGDQGLQCTFDSLPLGMTSLLAIGKDGRPLSRSGGGSSGSNIICNFGGPADAVESLVIRVKPSCTRVVMNLPEFPIVPAANRQTSDLMKMVVPPVVVRDEWAWQSLMGSILQLQYDTSPGNTPGLWPMDVGGKTVGELLAFDAARHPGTEVVVSSSRVMSVLRREPIGKTRTRLAPGRSVLAGLWRLCIPVLAILALWKAILLLRGAALRRALRPRGYGELTIWQAEFLAAKLGLRAWQLPPHDELAALPGVDLEDLRTVVALMRGRVG